MKPADLAIYIVDDDSSVSGALRRLVRSAGFMKVALFNTAEDFLKHAVLEGGCLLISHNSEFTNTCCTETWKVEDGVVKLKGKAPAS